MVPRPKRGDYTAKRTGEYKNNVPLRMIYYNCHMKKRIHPAIIFTVLFFLVVSCAMTVFSTKHAPSSNTANTALFLQATPTPPVEEDQSEVGSTDGIVAMGGVIAVIILLPLLLQRKAWMQKERS